MAASAGHAVAYTIGPIFKHIIDCMQLYFTNAFGYMARGAVLLKSNVVNILLFNFCEQKLVQHGPVTIAIDCNGLSLLIFEEKWPNYASRPKFVPNND